MVDIASATASGEKTIKKNHSKKLKAHKRVDGGLSILILKVS